MTDTITADGCQPDLMQNSYCKKIIVKFLQNNLVQIPRFVHLEILDYWAKCSGQISVWSVRRLVYPFGCSLPPPPLPLCVCACGRARVGVGC